MKRTPPSLERLSNVLPFPEPAPRLRSDVPPFDPSNPTHLRAWEAIFDFGRAS
jgi:hypothetical protein